MGGRRLIASERSRAPATVVPLLRWAGSKKRQFGLISRFFPSEFAGYAEPFAGSAAFLFRLGVKNAKINDINQDVTDFYASIKKDPKKILEEFLSIPRNSKSYYLSRDEFNRLARSTRRSALFYYLNRNCFNGIYRVNQCGEFNVPFSNNRVPPYLSEDQFLSAASLLSKARISRMDFEDFCGNKLEHGDFVYIDPPYYEAGTRIFNEYNETPFGPSDFARLQKTLARIERHGAKFLLSFPQTEEAKELARQWRSVSFPVFRSIAGDASKRHPQREMLISNYAPKS